MPAPVVAYTSTEACPKCGNADTVKFNIGFIRPNVIEGKDYEFMDLSCQRCGWQVDLLPMDA